jgi:tetratricopeptide (TPR) repeat protein
MPLKEEAIIFPYGDSIFPIWHLLYVEERRSDISVLTSESLLCSWYIELIKKIHPTVSFPFNKIAIKDFKYHNLNEVKKDRLKRTIFANFGRFPIYVGFTAKKEAEIQKDYLFLPDGVFFRLFSKESNEELKRELLKRNLQFVVRGICDEIIPKDKTVSEIMNSYSAAYSERGNLYRLIDVDMSIAEYKKALTISPSLLPIQLNLGFAYLNDKDYDKAIEIFKKIAKEFPDYQPSLVHSGLGLVYQNKSRIDDAIKEYKIALRLDPNNARAKQMLEAIKEQKNRLTKIKVLNILAK